MILINDWLRLGFFFMLVVVEFLFGFESLLVVVVFEFRSSSDWLSVEVDSGLL